MNNHAYPPSKKPRLNISYGGSSQMPVLQEVPGTQSQATESMDLADDWDGDDNLFIEAADEFDKLIALSQAVPTTNVIIHPTGQQNFEDKPFPLKLATVNFESPKSSKAKYSSPSNSTGSKFPRSKSFNFDEIASNHNAKKNGACANDNAPVSENTIKQSELYRTKCGENEILQKQIKNLTTNLHESKSRQRQLSVEKDREKALLKQEMENKLQELRSELDRLNTELIFQKNHITSTEFRTKDLRNVRLKDPESPTTSTGNAAWKMMDEMNSSFSLKTSPLRGKASPLCGKTSPLASGFKAPMSRESALGAKINEKTNTGTVKVDNHFGCVLNNIVGDKLLSFKDLSDGTSSVSPSVVTQVGFDLVQLVTCSSFQTPKAQHLIRNILSSCYMMLCTEMSSLEQLSTSEDKGEITKRDHILSKSCFSVLPDGRKYDLLQAQKLFDSEEAVELRRCIKLVSVICSLSSYALSFLLNIPMSELARENAIVHSLESSSSISSDTITAKHLDILSLINRLVTEVASQNRTKCYNGLLLSIAHLMLTIFQQKLSLPETAFDSVCSIVKELLLSRPAPGVLEVVVQILAESTYSPQLQKYLCGQSDLPSCRASVVSNVDIVHCFKPQSCAVHVLCTYLNLFRPSSSLIRAYLTWVLRLLAVGRSGSLRDSNCRPCDCTSEMFHLCLVLSWTSVRKMCKHFKAEQDVRVKQEIKSCVELAYQALYKMKQDRNLQVLQRDGLFEALQLHLKTSDLNVNLPDKIHQSLTVDKDGTTTVAPSSGNPDRVRSIICKDHLTEDFNDLDIY